MTRTRTDLPRVVVTGAAGSIGSLVVTRCADRWRIVAGDVRARGGPAEESASSVAGDVRAGGGPPGGGASTGPGVMALDVTDIDACRRAFAGADAVVHLAADPEPDADWAALHGPNVVGAHAVAAAARDCAVRRLVLASSLQAVSAHGPDGVRRAGDPPRPANLYGATKAWAEALGAWVAASSTTSVVALRIGFFPGGPPPPGTSDVDRAAWLSPDDCVRLVVAAVEGPVDGFTVLNGVSANRRRLAELGRAERALGFVPRDDAWAG